MAFYDAGQIGAKEAWQRNVSAAMKRRAEQTKCQSCNRKNAMQKVLDFDGKLLGKQCRWCKFEKSMKELTAAHQRQEG